MPLNLHATTIELGSRAGQQQLLSPCVAATETHSPWSLCSAIEGAIAMRNPGTATRDKFPLTAN